MKRFFKYFKGNTVIAILAPTFKLLEATLELLVPLFLGKMIDEGIKASNTQNIIKYFIIMLLIAIFGLLFSVIGQAFSARASVSYASRLREELFNTLLDKSISDIDDIGASTMITRLTSDMNQVQNGVNLFLRLLLRSPFVVFGSLLFARILVPSSSFIFLYTIIILFVVVFIIMLYTIPLYKKVQDSLDNVVLKTKESIKGARVIRSFNQESEEISEFDDQTKKLFTKEKRVSVVSSLLNPLTYLIINLSIVFLLKFTSDLVNKGIILSGDVVALYNYMGLILVELIKFASLVITISKALASFNRISKLLNNRNVLKQYDTCNTEDYLSFSKVSFSYNNLNSVISDLSFSVNPGEMIGIIGPVASGKSTILSLINGFYYPTKGSISILGKDIRDYPKDLLNEIVGQAFQKSVIFRGTIRENILYGLNKSDTEVLEALRCACGEDIITTKKEGLDYILEPNGRNLSGGQKQRIALARVILRKPKILLLDDITSSLDNNTSRKVIDNILKLDNDTTIIMVSQRPTSLERANRILVLDKGKIDGFDIHENLLRDSLVYQELISLSRGDSHDN